MAHGAGAVGTVHLRLTGVSSDCLGEWGARLTAAGTQTPSWRGALPAWGDLLAWASRFMPGRDGHSPS